MSNESSIEWIIKQLIFKTEFENLPIQYVLMSDKDIDSIIEQAKAMHMLEICDAHYYGQESDRMSDTWNDHPEHWAFEYYLKKFNNQQQ